MPLIGVRAEFHCDDCGSPFSVDMEPSYVPEPGWSVYDIAVDAVRGSIRYTGPFHDGLRGVSSVQGDRCLCGRCTDIHDKEPTDG